MASNLKTKAGTVTTDNTTSTIVTGFGFQPKTVIFVVAPSAVDSGAAGQSIGFSDGTHHRCVGWGSTGGVSTTSCRLFGNATKCAVVVTTSAVSLTATCAMDADGFTLTWSANSGSAIVNYIAFGGSDLANVLVGTGTMPTVTGNLTVSGLGFTPNFVMLLSGSNTGNVASTATNARISYGAAISTTARCAHALGVRDAQTTSANVNAVSLHRSDACLVGVTAVAGVDYVADFVSFGSGQFVLNFSVAPVAANVFYYLAIGGSNLTWDIDTAARPTTASDQSRTGLSFRPDAVLWSNSDLTTLATITSTAALSLGFSDGSTSESGYATESDAIPTTAGTQQGTNPVQDADPADSSVSATLTSFNSDGWTITWGGTGAANQISSISVAGQSQSVGEMVASTQYGQIQPFSLRTQIIDY